MTNILICASVFMEVFMKKGEFEYLKFKELPDGRMASISSGDDGEARLIFPNFLAESGVTYICIVTPFALTIPHGGLMYRRCVAANVLE